MTVEAKQQLAQLAQEDQRSVAGMCAIIYRIGLQAYLGGTRI